MLVRGCGGSARVRWFGVGRLLPFGWFCVFLGVWVWGEIWFGGGCGKMGVFFFWFLFLRKLVFAWLAVRIDRNKKGILRIEEIELNKTKIQDGRDAKHCSYIDTRSAAHGHQAVSVVGRNEGL